MAVRIRMKKMGRRHRPFFRVCVMDARKPRDGKTIEEVGLYDPMVRDKSQRIRLKMDRIDYWLSVGAQPSEKDVDCLIAYLQSLALPPNPFLLPDGSPDAAVVRGENVFRSEQANCQSCHRGDFFTDG